MRRARARFAAWPAEGDVDTLARGGGVPVPDSFDALVDGLERSYRRGQRRWEAAAKGKRVNVRRWARDVTDLGHQLELVAAAWPGMVSAWVAVCRNLGTALADDLGHAALARTAERGTPPLDDVEHALLTSLSAHARGELASIATALGTRIYAESPSDFAARIGSYWNTRA